MTRGAYRLRDKCIEVIAREQYQPGYPKWVEWHDMGMPKRPGVSKTTTWCNEAANAILIELEYDTRQILHPKGIGWTSATTMYDNSVAMSSRNLSGVFKIDGRLAQALANIGIPILAAARDITPANGTISHVGIVCPDESQYDDSRGPLISQAGAVNGTRYCVNSFPGLSAPAFFLLPPKAE